MKNVVCAIFLLASGLAKSQNPPDISLVFYLDENSENGTLIGTVVATDPEGGALIYSIVSGNDDKAFAIDASAGDITVLNQDLLDFETMPIFDLMVEADDGNGAMTTVAININLNDIDEDVLGVDDFEGQIMVYPNPVTESIFIEVKQGPIKELEILLYSIAGELMPIELEFITGSVARIDFTKLPKGTYLIKMPELNFYQRISCK